MQTIRFVTGCKVASALIYLTCAVAFSVIAGCSDSPYSLAPVGGTISIDGKPLTQGKVMFAPVARGDGLEAGKAAVGIIQPDGTFKLSTYRDGDGAIVGEHWVTIFGQNKSREPANFLELPAFSKHAIRHRFRVLGNQENQFDIELTSDELLQFGQR